MNRECIVHFRLVRGDEIKHLRGLIFLESGQQEPSNDQLIDCFSSMGLKVQADPHKRLTFLSQSSNDRFHLEVQSFDLGEDKELAPDRTVRALAQNFIKKQPPIS